MKLIYQPSGKAYEYCHWACNLYNGCSNLCTYCYNRKGLAHNRLGKDFPTLKACVKNEDEAYELFKKELQKYKERIINDGGELFFNFVSDPCLPETIELNFKCILFAIRQGIKCRMLTKRTEVYDHISQILHDALASGNEGKELRDAIFSNLLIGFTLTYRDDLEPGASSNLDRIHTLNQLHLCGIQTWVSIEPVIDIEHSFEAIRAAYDHAHCRNFKIGLLSGKRNYTPEEVRNFKERVEKHVFREKVDVLWKDSVLEYINKN